MYNVWNFLYEFNYRKNRRKILNEEELVDIVKPLAPVDLLTLEKMTVVEQVNVFLWSQ